MSFDYFYSQQGDLFTFYRVPKVLFTNERFWNISADAKMLYGILLDRMSLSAKNGWIDKNGRVYIIFTIDEAKMALNCAEQKAIKLLSELEKKAGLIERKRQGLGKPNLIYVKNFISAVDSQLLDYDTDNRLYRWNGRFFFTFFIHSRPDRWFLNPPQRLFCPYPERISGCFLPDGQYTSGIRSWKTQLKSILSYR